MRVHSVLFVLAVVLVATTRATALPNSPKMMKLEVVAGERVDARTPRFLRKHYNVDANGEERGIVNTLKKAKSLFPSKVTEKTLQRWLANEKAPKYALTRLNLNNAGTKLFEKPEFITWFNYMDRLNKNNPEGAIMKILLTRYTDDTLWQMITAAQKVTSTKDIATKLQAEQLRLWAKKGKLADDVYTLFKLDKVDKSSFANLVDNPQFTTWTKYVDDFSRNDPDKANSLLAKTLTTYYTNEGLYKMMSSAKNVDSTKALATNIQKGQVQNWLDAKEPLHRVSTWIGAKGTPSGSPERAAVKDYLRALNKLNSN